VSAPRGGLSFVWGALALCAAAALQGCGDEASTTGGGGTAGSAGAGGSAGSGAGGTTTGTTLPPAPCEQGNIVLRGTLDGQDVSIDLPKSTWDYKGPGTTFVVSFEGGSVGLNPKMAGGGDTGKVPVTGGLDLPPAAPHGNDILCVEDGTLSICDGGGLAACADKTYRFQMELLQITKTSGGTCAVKGTKKTPISGQLVGCLLDKL
jgi:hypothetical protein